ncbi:hypothetical protein GTY63_41935 [Amycolatopsis rubida]|nr:hypothetical protein [Amycolatopsis rubida]
MVQASTISGRCSASFGSGGSGLGGMRRRIEALDGAFALASSADGPPTLTVSLPCGL